MEREDEIRALHDAVVAASRGEGRLVLLAGDAGAGKTSLVRELAGHEKVRLGACEPLSVPAPLAPVCELAPDLPELIGEDRVALARALLDFDPNRPEPPWRKLREWGFRAWTQLPG